jgi:Tfp pilus assembly protein PilF
VKLEALVAARPRDHLFHLRLASVYATLGLRAETDREIRTAMDLMPVSKDALDGSVVAYGSAILYTRIGEPDAGIKILQEFMSRTHYPAVSPTWLGIDSTWTPIRSDPRFQKLVATAK